MASMKQGKYAVALGVAAVATYGCAILGLPPDDLTVSPQSEQIAVGATLNLEAEAEWLLGSEDVTDDADWSVSDPALATVDESGVLLGLAEGTVTVTAEVDGTSDSSTITIGNPCPPPLAPGVLCAALVAGGPTVFGNIDADGFEHFYFLSPGGSSTIHLTNLASDLSWQLFEFDTTNSVFFCDNDPVSNGDEVCSAGGLSTNTLYIVEVAEWQSTQGTFQIRATSP